MKKLWPGLFLFVVSCTSSGGSWQHFRLTALGEARERNMTIFLHIYQEENPLCERQKKDLEAVIQDPAFSKVGAYRVIWGKEKAVETTFQISQPCTLLVFKGANIKTRISSDVGADLFRAALKQGL